MQPLMYQFTNVTCWYASMINAILLLRRRCTEVPCESLVSPMEDRLLRSLASQYTEFSECQWRSDNEYEYYVSVMRCLGEIAHFEVHVFRKGDVINEVRRLTFDQEVAVCNINNGKHAVLLHGREESQIECFDPYWVSVNHEEKNANFAIEPGRSPTNLSVTEEHLLSVGTDGFRMGGNHRVLTILRAKRYPAY